jgi:hypothetical protein
MTECQYGCGKELTWDKSRRSDSGKMIPIDTATNEPHNCPNSPYNKSKSGQAEATGNTAKQQTMDTGTTTLSLAERIGVLEAALASVQARLNKLDPVLG